MVLEPNTGRCASKKAELRSGVDMRRCASKDAGPQRGMDCEIPTSVGEENETFFIKVWKPLPNRRVLKP